MSSTPATTRRAGLLGLVPLSVLAAPMVLAAWAVGGSSLAAGVGVAVGAALFVGLLADGVVWLTGVATPFERLLAAMGVRGFLAATLLLVAVKGLAVDPKVAVAVATPLYLSLVAGEVLSAMRLSNRSMADATAANGEGAC